ncbi:MAG: SRPBCC family protein [Deltaproteobacteria bacterium]|nr:SRPBCC family protein [Deltaproteobacteria bacterium]
MTSSSSSSSLALLLPLLVILAAGPAFADDGIKVWTEKVAGSDIPFAIVEATIDAPPAAVWDIVSHCDGYVRHMPRVAESKELKREGDDNVAFTTTCRVVADLPFPLGDLTSVSKAVHTVEPGVKYVRKWTFLSGDYEVNEGSWTVVAVDEGKKTKATYRLRAKPKLALPDSMLASFQQQTLPDVIKKLREGTRKKP